MVWLGSPARGLDDMVSAVASTRKLPPEQWQQIREQLCQGLDHYRRMVDPGAKVSEETIAGLLDHAQAMGDDEFDAARETLGREWAKVLLPNAIRQLEDPEYRKNVIQGRLRHWVTYINGAKLVAALMEGP